MKRLLYILLILILAGAVTAVACYYYATESYEYETKRVNIPAGVTDDGLKRLLVDELGKDFGSKVYRIWSLRGGSLTRARGSYIVKSGDTAFRTAMRLRGGMQDAVKVTVANRRSLDEAIAALSENFEFNAFDFSVVLDSLTAAKGINAENEIALMLPDTYEFYWTAGPAAVASSFIGEWEKFWNEQRREKASRLGLSPMEVSTLASIVEEESAKADERPVIARLYLNRLERGMRLQADPTVKYAVGDPTLRRILSAHLSTPSPYNTYLVDGLPPGPIRMVDKATIDAVLNAPQHNYLYMCAREDFSGYHNFASTLAQHNANAARYHAALNRNNIR